YQFLNGGGEDTDISGSGVLSQRPPPSRLPRPAALLSLTVESRFSAGSLVRNSLGDLSRNRSFRILPAAGSLVRICALGFDGESLSRMRIGSHDAVCCKAPVL